MINRKLLRGFNDNRLPLKDEPGDSRTLNGIDAGKQLLFLVAADKYSQWGRIRGPVDETGELKKVLLSRYHFDEVKELYNEQATKEAIRDHLISLQEGRQNELKKNDSLFIYFSGHGQCFEEEPHNGYWIPYNGSADIDARAYWFSNSELTGLIKKIKANHILVVSDSCFAATLIDTERGAESCSMEKEYLKRFYHRCSRKVLTSGGMEPVPGNSQFARLFREELEKNTDHWIKAGMIYQAINRKIHNRTFNFPEYGNLKNTDFDPTASFVLFTKEGWKKLVNPQKTALARRVDRINRKLHYYRNEPGNFDICIRVNPNPGVTTDVEDNGAGGGILPQESRAGNVLTINLQNVGKDFSGELNVNISH